MENAREIKISFCVAGSIKQTIRLLNSVKLTPDEIVQGLNDGSILTTIQEGGTVEFLADGKKIGEVVNVDNECEYTEFDLERTLEDLKEFRKQVK
jgi:hypothetical protein